MALTRHLTALSLAACFATQAAWAQTVTLQSGYDRVKHYHDGTQPWWVSRRDCVDNDVFTFPVNLDLQGFSGSLEVWAGSTADCTDQAEREGDQADCWQVFDTFPTKATLDIKVRAQDLVAKTGPDKGTAADCDSSDASPAGDPVTLYFMLIDSSSVVKAFAKFDLTGIDVIGPSAPTGISAGIGENSLVVSWDAPDDADRAGYILYCDTSGGPGSSPAAGGAAGAATDAATDASATTDAATDASATTDAATESGAGGTDAGTDGGGGSGGSGGTDGGSAGNANCPSAKLIPGTIPTDTTSECGSTGSAVATKANATGLQNYVTYAVAVATKDKLGNVGPLSQVACGTPQIVDDFFELYKRAGGKGGGGFCAVNADPSRATLALAGIALGAWLVRRRRR